MTVAEVRNPIFVIHGVGNRNREAFAERVRSLQRAIGNRQTLVPVYWGDLGAEVDGIADTIPQVSATNVGDALPPGLAGPAVRTNPQELLAQAAERAASGPALVRAAAVVRSAVEQEWPSLQWLPQSDVEILEQVGELLGVLASHNSVGAGAPVFPTTGGGDELVRGLELTGFLRDRLRDLDRLVGSVIGRAAGWANEELRTRLGPGFTAFIGDVFIYQRHRDAVHQRVRDAIAEHGTELGTAQRPARILAHSLGGVICFDLAVAGEPRLWISELITFGSQSPFFHVLDPRGGSLKPYRSGHPVTLPPTLGTWCNLWEPLDPVAFIAAKVFRLHDGRPPTDTAVAHLVSAGLWTHSTYWELPELIRAIQEAMP